MTHLINAQRLLTAFNTSHDAAMPGLVFGLLDYDFDEGPFEFDAGKIADRLAASKFEHIAPEVLADFQPELERFFLPTAEGWVPRPGVLTFDQAPNS